MLKEREKESVKTAGEKNDRYNKANRSTLSTENEGVRLPASAFSIAFTLVHLYKHFFFRVISLRIILCEKSNTMSNQSDSTEH